MRIAWMSLEPVSKPAFAFAQLAGRFCNEFDTRLVMCWRISGSDSHHTLGTFGGALSKAWCGVLRRELGAEYSAAAWPSGLVLDRNLAASEHVQETQRSPFVRPTLILALPDMVLRAADGTRSFQP